MQLKPSLLALAAAAAFAGHAQAAVVMGTTVGRPTWNRPLAGAPPSGLSAVGTRVPYDVYSFQVSTSGVYTFLDTSTSMSLTSPGPWDNFTFLYANAFNASTPLTNALIGNDDMAAIGVSGFNYTLTANTNYFFVTTGFGNTDYGTYTLSITQVVPNAVPEPTTGLLAGLGCAAVALSRRRRRVA